MSNVFVHNNLFSAVASGEGGHAACIKFAMIATGDIVFQDNTLATNDGIAGNMVETLMDLVRTTIVVTTPVSNPFIFETDYSTIQSLHTELRFVDTVFQDASSRSYFESAAFRNGHEWITGVPDDRAAFSSDWSTTIIAKDSAGNALTGANVQVSDTTGNVAYTGTTDSSGQVQFVASQFRTKGGTKTDFNNYQLSVTAGTNSVQQQVKIDAVQSIDVIVDGGGSGNHAPILDNSGTMTLNGLNEDQTGNTGQTVASIIASAGGDRITDPDTGALEGIAITATSNGNGTWQFSTNNGSSWSAVGAVSNTSSLLLRDIDLLRFVPNAQNGTTADLTFRAWDQTSGSYGTKVDTSTNGGSSAFSSAVESASINVTSVNDAPLLDNSGTMTFTTINQNQTNNAGNTVAAIIASAGGNRISDVDTGAVEGIAITSLNSGNGTWQFSTNNGSSWNAVGSVSNSSALLLRSVDLLRFVPNGQNGTSADITFRAWDQTNGNFGTKVNTSTNGGSSAFSTTVESASITVTSMNSAPVLDNTGTMTLTAIDEDQSNNGGDTIAAIIASAGGDRITDSDPGRLKVLRLPR